jgi:TetR/AcrR family transcriptional regulator, copper-responsive repressor
MVQKTRKGPPAAPLPPKRRGRPRAYEPDVALGKALDLFRTSGFSATSLDDLSAATGMNRPSLYGAFGDKRELYLAALRRYWQLSRVAMDEALAYDRPLREALRRLYRKALASYFGGKDGARGCFAIGTATTEALRDAKIRALLAEGFQMIDDAFAARIRFAREHGDLPKRADPAALAMLASATLHTLAIRSRAGAARSMLEAMADATVDVICGPAPH